LATGYSARSAVASTRAIGRFTLSYKKRLSLVFAGAAGTVDAEPTNCARIEKAGRTLAPNVTARQQRCAPASLPVRSDSGVDDDDDGEETELECCGRVTAGALGARAR